MSLSVLAILTKHECGPVLITKYLSRQLHEIDFHQCYISSTRTRSSMETLRLPLRFRSVFAQGKLLTTNWTAKLNILSMGENSVYPLYEVD